MAFRLNCKARAECSRSPLLPGGILVYKPFPTIQARRQETLPSPCLGFPLSLVAKKTWLYNGVRSEIGGRQCSSAHSGILGENGKRWHPGGREITASHGEKWQVFCDSPPPSKIPPYCVLKKINSPIDKMQLKTELVVKPGLELNCYGLIFHQPMFIGQ